MQNSFWEKFLPTVIFWSAAVKWAVIMIFLIEWSLSLVNYNFLLMFVSWYTVGTPLAWDLGLARRKIKMKHKSSDAIILLMDVLLRVKDKKWMHATRCAIKGDFDAQWSNLLKVLITTGNLYFDNCFLKEIGTCQAFIKRKSFKIGISEKCNHEHHLAKFRE